MVLNHSGRNSIIAAGFIPEELYRCKTSRKITLLLQIHFGSVGGIGGGYFNYVIPR